MKKFILVAIGFLSILAFSPTHNVAKAETPVNHQLQVQDSCSFNEIAIAEHNYNFVFETNVITEVSFIYSNISLEACLPGATNLKFSDYGDSHPDLAVINYATFSEMEKPVDVRLDLWYQLQKSRFYQFQKYLNARRSFNLPPILVC